MEGLISEEAYNQNRKNASKQVMAVEVLNFFQASLRNCINCIHCDEHFFIFRLWQC